MKRIVPILSKIKKIVYQASLGSWGINNIYDTTIHIMQHELFHYNISWYMVLLFVC